MVQCPYTIHSDYNTQCSETTIGISRVSQERYSIGIVEDFFFSCKIGVDKTCDGDSQVSCHWLQWSARALCSWVPSTRPRCLGVRSRESVSLLQYLCLSRFLFIFAPVLVTIEIESISCIDLFSWLCVIQGSLCVPSEGISEAPLPNSKITIQSSQWNHRSDIPILLWNPDFQIKCLTLYSNPMQALISLWSCYKLYWVIMVLSKKCIFFIGQLLVVSSDCIGIRCSYIELKFGQVFLGFDFALINGKRRRTSGLVHM